MKVKARYSFAAETSDAVFIKDLNDGAMSVTNDAEAVVEELLKKYPGKLIFYRDTMGNWDELKHNGKTFTGFGICDRPIPPFAQSLF